MLAVRQQLRVHEEGVGPWPSRCHRCGWELDEHALAKATAGADNTPSGRLRPSAGTELVRRERRRQCVAEGFAAEHDARHTSGELATAAWCYLSSYLDERFGLHSPEQHGPDWSGIIQWPWSGDAYKPTTDPVRCLTKAGALVVAEIDRLLAGQSGAPNRPPR